jgi:hypothetical protein
MAKSPLNVVRTKLQAYADRGIFRGFSEVKAGPEKRAFKFIWLTEREMDLSVDVPKNTLRFKHLLPQVPADSAMYDELKSFIRLRHDGNLPEHRRIDRKRAEVTCSNQKGAVSISLKVKNNQYAYGVNKIVNLVHELFVHLHDAYPDYLAENFDVPQE